VTFSAKKSPRSLVDMTFDRRGGVLEIPTVESYMNHAIFANLLAYEQCRGRWCNTPQLAPQLGVLNEI